MIYNEVEFTVFDGHKNAFLRKSFYNIGSIEPIVNLKVGQSVEVEFNNQIIDCKVLKSEFGDYNVRGFLLKYDLELA